MKSHSVIAYQKNDVIASETNYENDTYSMLKFKIFSAMKFIRSKKNTDADTDKISTEQVTHDSQGIPDSSQINAIPPINTSILDISTELVTENLCGSKSKENNLIHPLNIDTPQFSENSTIPSIPTDCNTPQLANIVDKLSTNQDMEKIETQLNAVKSYIKVKSLILIKKLNLCMSVLMT